MLDVKLGGNDSSARKVGTFREAVTESCDNANAISTSSGKWARRSGLTHVVTTHSLSVTEAVQRSTSTDGAVSGQCSLAA